MSSSSPADSLARQVLDRVLRLRRGRSLLVESWTHALPWARALIVGARQRGAPAILVIEDERAFFEALASSGRAFPRPFVGRLARPDATVRFDGPEAFPRLLALDRDRVDQMLPSGSPARRPRRGRAGRTVRLRIADATPTAAQRFAVDLGRWQAELLRASLVDPQTLFAPGRRLTRSLGGARRLRIRHPNGTDLSLRLAAGPRIWTGAPSDGPRSELPSGLWVARIASGTAAGTWEANRPSYDRLARSPVVSGARLRFVAGRLREFDCETGEEALAAFVRSGRGRVRPVALTVGLNREVDRGPEIAALAAGTVSVWVGAPPPSGGAAGPRFSFVASLAGASLEPEGRPRIAEPLSPRGGRRTPRPSSGRAPGDGRRSAPR